MFHLEGFTDYTVIALRLMVGLVFLDSMLLVVLCTNGGKIVLLR